MMKRFNFFNLSSIIMIVLVGMSYEIDAQKISTQELDLMFYDYKIVTLDSRNLHEVSRNNHFFEAEIPKRTGEGTWNLELHNSGIISDDYISQYTSENGVVTGPKTTAIPTKGNVVGDLTTRASLTFNDGFVYGFIQDETGYNYIHCWKER